MEFPLQLNKKDNCIGWRIRGRKKCTAVKLAARFWDVTEGKITLGGIDISTIDQEAFLKNFSIVFQDVVLFNDTILKI